MQGFRSENRLDPFENLRVAVFSRENCENPSPVPVVFTSWASVSQKGKYFSGGRRAPRSRVFYVQAWTPSISFWESKDETICAVFGGSRIG
jgi:hypothetical protein